MPQKSRSRPGFLSGYASRRIAMGSEWRRSMCARMRRTITECLSKARDSSRACWRPGFLHWQLHRQVNPALPAVSAFIQTRDDFFHGSCYRLGTSLLVAANSVFALLDDVTLPASTNHVTWRIRRLYRNDFIVIGNQGEVPCSCVLLRNPDPKMEDMGRAALKLDQRVQTIPSLYA